MKIAVNTRLLLEGKMDGIAWFTYETMKRITVQHPEHEFLFIFDRPFSESFIFSGNVTGVIAHPQSRHPVLWYMFFEFGIPAVLKKHKPQLFFSPDGWLSLNTQVKSMAVIHDLNFETSSAIADFVMKKFQEGEYDKVEIIYNEFKNVATQIVRAEQFLPILPTEDQESDTDYIYEPSQEAIVNNVIPSSLRVQLYKSLLESNAAEHGARMTAMDQATDNAGELLDQLRLTYNQTRQAAITKEILEIVGGAEALNN